MILGYGATVAAVGVGILAVALLASAMPLIVGAIALGILGGAVMLVGIGMTMAAKGLQTLVIELLKIPPGQITAVAAAIGALGLNLMILGLGSGLAAVGLGVLAAAVLLTAIPLLLGSFALGTFGAALMIVGIGMTLVSAGASSLASSVTVFSRVLPQLREFTSALKDIGGASWGIIKTAAAMTALTASLGPFAFGLALLQLKKLEALAEFNKSATLTVKNVQKPAIPNQALAATETAMDNAGTSSGSSAPKGGVSKPVINFSQKSIVVKIGERELQDVFIEFLKHPEVANAISGMGN